MEGGAGTEGGRGFATVIFNPVKAGDWWVGGRTDAHFTHPPGAFLIHVTVPEGYMNTAHKNEVHRLVDEAVLAVTGQGTEKDAGGSLLTIIDEVTEGNWGCAGQPIGLGSIAGAVGMPTDGDRFAWVRAYFAAKARDCMPQPNSPPIPGGCRLRAMPCPDDWPSAVLSSSLVGWISVLRTARWSSPESADRPIRDDRHGAGP